MSPLWILTLHINPRQCCSWMSLECLSCSKFKYKNTYIHKNKGIQNSKFQSMQAQLGDETSATYRCIIWVNMSWVNKYLVSPLLMYMKCGGKFYHRLRCMCKKNAKELCRSRWMKNKKKMHIALIPIWVLYYYS